MIEAGVVANTGISLENAPQGPVGPQGGTKAMREVEIPGTINVNDTLYENHLDHQLFIQRMNRGHAASWTHYYTDARDALEKSVRADVPLNDPHFAPLDAEDPVGCPRPIDKL